MMEHRISSRSSIRLQIALYCDRIGVLLCKTRDISLEGMFIETGRISLPVYAPVEAVFAMHGMQNRSESYRLQAHIVRTAKDGMGIMFRNVDIVSFRFLRDLLYPAKTGS